MVVYRLGVFYWNRKMNLLTSVINSLEGIRRQFLWSGGDNKSKIKWVAWEHDIVPKKSGGLGDGYI